MGGQSIDGILVEAGETSYKITGLKNRVVTGVHVRSFTGSARLQSAAASSHWVRVKGKDTTPVADEVTFDATDYSVTEGGTVSLGTIRYAISDASLGSPLTFTLATADGTADSSDYTGFSGRSVAMASNVATAATSVVTTSDDLVEEDETLTVTISVPETSKFGAGDPSTATVTIEDDDRASATIAFGSDAASTTKYTDTVAEAVSGGTLNVPVTVSHLPSTSTTFKLEVLSRKHGNGGQRLQHCHQERDIRTDRFEQDQERRHYPNRRQRLRRRTRPSSCGLSRRTPRWTTWATTTPGTPAGATATITITSEESLAGRIAFGSDAGVHDEVHRHRG